VYQDPSISRLNAHSGARAQFYMRQHIRHFSNSHSVIITQCYWVYNKTGLIQAYRWIAHASAALYTSLHDLFLNAWACLQTARYVEKKRGRKWRAKMIEVGYLSLFESKMISVWRKPTIHIKPPLHYTCITHPNYEPQFFVTVTDKFRINDFYPDVWMNGRKTRCG